MSASIDNDCTSLDGNRHHPSWVGHGPRFLFPFYLRTYDEQSYAEQEALIQAKEYVYLAQWVAIVSQHTGILGFNFYGIEKLNPSHSSLEDAY